MTSTTQPAIDRAIDRAIDIFPAKLVIDFTQDQPKQQTLGKVRTRLDVDSRLRVWQEAEAYPHEPELIIDAIVTDVPTNTIGNNAIPRRQQQLALVTSKGRWLLITPQPGCGCGSRLKALSNAALNGQAGQQIRPWPSSNQPGAHTSRTRNQPDAIANNWPTSQATSQAG